MPVISYFFGIYVRMYHADHGPAHFHVEYQGHEALIACQLETGAESRTIGADCRGGR